MYPKARTARLLVSDLDDEVVLYDLAKDRAHHLNPSAAWVWRRADGRTPVEEMAAELPHDLGGTRRSEVVTVALERLRDAGLLEGERASSDVPRRRAVKILVGATAAVLPVVTSLTAPTPAMARSGADPEPEPEPEPEEEPEPEDECRPEEPGC